MTNAKCQSQGSDDVVRRYLFGCPLKLSTAIIAQKVVKL
eukprot:CAMPEP_0197603996 /NCGR_PEP_ID=MMETSP1326-20131121/40331_1 /TAXON_ID=1155430 /ORGANISM="Genus nov. species nov., Strain RCC2288" /LENGTH=38 /DNA_ID= /DNA_START= /DNA_END= /DNA_ORIENTATION=